ncbi:Teneurin-m [Caenorhabditis elegans]|uniref:Teneurin-m n=1 Tax=Caenorhabditis elegans TaxID=6239 RepID=Q9XWA9_CAEEL|nr:Teneurin-m [Caenorhabditis elegans]CAA22054.1 Teneurin-m [Caenorhabditis elegans]|eukprot:NP_492705.1 Uncharacterized protein CELE_Y106G6G.4 [Caenorhabditis elegans]
MSNDYEYLGNDSQMPPPPPQTPVAPRPPKNAHPDLLSGLDATPALKANDDVDLESNRPPRMDLNNLSFSDGVNPKRSEQSVVPISRSSESDEHVQNNGAKNKKKYKRKNSKFGTCWCCFAAVTIFLAVICILGLGAMLLLNEFLAEEDTKSDALTGGSNTTNTTTAPPATNSTQIISTLRPPLNRSTSSTDVKENGTTHVTSANLTGTTKIPVIVTTIGFTITSTDPPPTTNSSNSTVESVTSVIPINSSTVPVLNTTLQTSTLAESSSQSVVTVAVTDAIVANSTDIPDPITAKLNGTASTADRDNAFEDGEDY